jgi:UDP-N-acetylmuramoyl-tripeptide--D-alanyl-D-alanine ligase
MSSSAIQWDAASPTGWTIGMLQLSAAAALLQTEYSGADRFISGVSSDSRAIQAGDLFIALRGPNFDGHDFVPSALAAGAAAAMVERGYANALLAAGLPLLVVDDCRLALGRLAALWRGRFDLPLIALTGSNGKTTVKEMLAAILRAELTPGAGAQVASYDGSVLATRGNLNNDIGVPLTLLRLRDHHRFAVIEMGMNRRGEIGYLSSLARPTIALVLNAQRAHLEGLHDLASVAQAKGEILSGLGTGGCAVINADDQFAALWRTLAAPHRVLEFGAGGTVQAHSRSTPSGSELHLVTPIGESDCLLRVAGQHNVTNAAAAAAAAVAAGVSLHAISTGLSAFEGVPGRLQLRRGRNGACVIDDSYNANPDSMRAAIDVLAAYPGERVLIAGDMGEVGRDGDAFHAEIGSYARQRGIDQLLAVGVAMRHAVAAFGPSARHFAETEELIAAAEGLARRDATVLVKASRFMRLERVVAALVEV